MRILPRFPDRPANASSDDPEIFVSFEGSQKPRRDLQNIRDKIEAEFGGSKFFISLIGDESEFKNLISSHSLYQRQIFERWDDGYHSQTLPCFILGVDFDSCPGWRYKPACSGDWRLIDHQVDGTHCGHVVPPAIILEPTAEGRALLTDLSESFLSWGEALAVGEISDPFCDPRILWSAATSRRGLRRII